MRSQDAQDKMSTSSHLTSSRHKNQQRKRDFLIANCCQRLRSKFSCPFLLINFSLPSSNILCINIYSVLLSSGRKFNYDEMHVLFIIKLWSLWLCFLFCIFPHSFLLPLNPKSFSDSLTKEMFYCVDSRVFRA